MEASRWPHRPQTAARRARAAAAAARDGAERAQRRQPRHLEDVAGIGPVGAGLLRRAERAAPPSAVATRARGLDGLRGHSWLKVGPNRSEGTAPSPTPAHLQAPFVRLLPCSPTLKKKYYFICMYISRCISRNGDGFFRVATSFGCRGCGSSRRCSAAAGAVGHDDVPRRVMQKADQKRKGELA